MEEFNNEIILPEEERQGMILELDGILEILTIEKRILEKNKEVLKKDWNFIGYSQVIDTLFLICLIEKIKILKFTTQDEIEESDDISRIMKRYFELLGRNKKLANFSVLVEQVDTMFAQRDENEKSENKDTYDKSYVSWRNGCSSMIRNMYIYIQYKLEEYSDDITKCQIELYDISHDENDEHKIR